MVMWKTAASKLTSQLKYYYSWIFLFLIFLNVEKIGIILYVHLLQIQIHIFHTPVFTFQTIIVETCNIILCENTKESYLYLVVHYWSYNLQKLQNNQNMYLGKVKFFGHDDLNIKA